MAIRSLTRSTETLPGLFEDFFRPWNAWFGNGGQFGKTFTVPAVNITENSNEFLLSLAVPGMKKQDFTIDVNGDMLTISSENEESKEEKEATFTRKEYNYSSFSRNFSLPDEVDKEKINASYENGVLQLKLPKYENAKKELTAKHITVK